MNTTLNPGQRLLWYIDAVLMEQRKFCAWCHAQKQDINQLEAMHREGIRYHEGFSEGAHICKRHVAILEQHGNIHRRHEDVSRYCVSLLNRINDFEMAADEITGEVEHLATLYDQLRHDHTRMLKERRQLVKEHDAVLASMSVNH